MHSVYRYWLARLSKADVVFLGEIHDDPVHHVYEHDVLRDLVASGRRPALVMEQFDADRQPRLEEARRRFPLDAGAVASGAGFDFTGWNWSYYAPLVQTALQRDLPLVGANLDARAAMAAAGGSAPAGAIAASKPLSAEGQAALRRAIATGHCGMLSDAMVDRMAAAQRVRDAYIANAVVPYAERGAVVIVGRGHARWDYGAVRELRARMPGTDIVAVGMTEEGSDASDSDVGPTSTPPKPRSVDRIYDFVWVAPAFSREDPCVGMRRSLEHAEKQTPSQAR